MAENQIEIEVELTGSQKVEKSIQGIETGLEGIGETGSRLVKAMGSTNEKLGEGLENVSTSVGEVREAFKGLTSSIKTLGSSGMSGILGLIGPLGLLVGAGITVYETFRQISGAAQEAEDAQEAMAAAAGDLQSRLESLAEKGIILATGEMLKFSMSVLESQFIKERIQKQQEKFAKNFESIRKQTQRVEEATQALTIAESVYAEGSAELAQKRRDLLEAEHGLGDARVAAENRLSLLNKELRSYLETTRTLAAQESKLEEQSTESLKKEALRLANLIKQNDELRFQNELRKDEIQLNEILTQINVDHIELTKALEDANRKQIEEILKGLKARTQGINEVTIAERKANNEREKIERDSLKRRREAYKKSQEDQAKIAERERKKNIVLDSRLRQLTIKQEQEGLDQLLSLESERHRASVALTKAGTKERLIEEKRFQLAVQNIMQKDIAQTKANELERLNAIKESNLKEIELRYDLSQSLLELETDPSATDFGQLKADQDQRLTMLELQYSREIELARVKGEDLSSIQKRFAIERMKMDQQMIEEQTELLTDYFDQYGKGFADAAVGALLFGDSFQEATAEVLKGLAQQAGVESLMSLAKGFAQIALGDPKAAASFKAAALFGTAAVVAGAAGNALSSGGGTGGAGATPSGAPTTAPTPQHEEVRNDAMVFNINFGGAVVYDTKKAAEQALADRLVTIMNTSRRGAPRMNRR